MNGPKGLGVSFKGFAGVSKTPEVTPELLPTRGMFASQIQCIKCGYKYPVHLNIFYSVPLALPQESFCGSVRLRDLLARFVSNELVHNVSCEGCFKSGEKSTFVKNLTFAKLPKVLCLHIQRMVMLSNGLPFKRNNHVVIPEYLDMDDFVYMRRSRKGPLVDQFFGSMGLPGGATPAASSLDPQIKLEPTPAPSANDQKPFRYRLSAAIVHFGDFISGHYVSYRRGSHPNSNAWFYASDTVVKQVSSQELFSMNAYMLFYEKMFS